jgi:hypothetical protein
MNDPIVIVPADRTALGSFQGGFAGLKKTGGKCGIASLCIGGSVAPALAVEML